MGDETSEAMLEVPWLCLEHFNQRNAAEGVMSRESVGIVRVCDECGEEKPCLPWYTGPYVETVQLPDPLRDIYFLLASARLNLKMFRDMLEMLGTFDEVDDQHYLRNGMSALKRAMDDLVEQLPEPVWEKRTVFPKA